MNGNVGSFQKSFIVPITSNNQRNNGINLLVKIGNTYMNLNKITKSVPQQSDHMLNSSSLTNKDVSMQNLENPRISRPMNSMQQNSFYNFDNYMPMSRSSSVFQMPQSIKKIEKIYNPVPVMTHYNMPVIHHIPINQVIKKYIPVYYPIPVEHRINIPVKIPIKVTQRVLIPQAVPYGVKVPVPIPYKVEIPQYKEIKVEKPIYIKVPVYEHIPIYHHFMVKDKKKNLRASETSNEESNEENSNEENSNEENNENEANKVDSEELNKQFKKYLAKK